jgi:CRISPR-associated protein Cmr3
MSARLFIFEPVDTWFFRDGTVFDRGTTTATGIASGFPPAVATLQGAVRASLAEVNGWSLAEAPHWPHGLGHPESPGPLRFTGPLLQHRGEWHWPAPRLWWEAPGGTLRRMRLGPPVRTDLGTVRLPLPERDHTLVTGWIPVSEFTRVLGDPTYIPRILPSTARREPHVGIARQDRKAVDGALYVAQHVRLEPTWALGVLVEGMPDDVMVPSDSLIKLGGEGRLARVHVVDPPPLLPEVPELVGSEGATAYLVTLLTSGRYENPAGVAKCGPPGLPGRVMGASVGPAERVGGFDLQRRQPRPLVSQVPAGSTWFVEAVAKDLEAARALHGRTTGQRPAFGDGLVAVGRWEDAE